MSFDPHTLDTKPIPRIQLNGDLAKLDQLIRAAQPFILEEADNEAFRAFAKSVNLDRFADVFGDRTWRVQECKKDEFDTQKPFHEQTAEMPFGDFLDLVRTPHAELQHYLNIWPGPKMEYAEELFGQLRELGPQIPMTRYGGQELRVFWMGGAGTTTPLHYDTYARSHGVVQGSKLFFMFPPDFAHHRLLEPHPIRSTIGWYSKIGAGPLDPSRFPKLGKTKGVHALCGPGDFLYLPPCWWHHVSIPSEPTISVSATFFPRSSYLYWYHWRLRFSRWLARHPRLLGYSQGQLSGQPIR